jgi:hypothetical protein
MDELPAKKHTTNLQWLLQKVSQWLWLGVVGALAYFGEHEKDGGFIKDLWEQAKIASPFAAMLALFLFMDERRERREAQQECQNRTIDYIQSTNLAHSALEKIASATAKRKGN